MGHSPRDVWSYVPRQLTAFLHFAGQRRKREAAQALSIGSIAASGDHKQVKKILRDLEK